jgi:tetratricopeptide (TPR) repeat protein
MGQAGHEGDFSIALANHNGHLSWSADGFKIVQSSVKSNGQEIGIRGRDNSGRLNFLGFLFLFPEQAPMTSTKCRDGVLAPAKSTDKSLEILGTSEISRPGALPVSLVDYREQHDKGKTGYMVRGFVATADICGDLEFYSDTPIHSADPNLQRVFSSLKLDPDYVPQFNDVFLYAQMLYDTQKFAAAGPFFEEALRKLETAKGEDTKTMTRVLTDQAGMAYGMSGDIEKARAIFDHAITTDPDYPMYYYNLACADAEQHDLAGARKHLQEAFDRKANVIHGETMPDPTEDDSFKPYHNDTQFWSFVESLRSR